MNKFYLIDKPLDVTSFDVIRILRKKINMKKMGHTGTLDPLATGGLLIATGDYTKLIPYFEKDTKEYEFSVKFDGISDSFDLGTEVTFISEEAQEKARKSITEEKIEEILLTQFTGKITQVPPKYSALKLGGKKALDRVKAGEEFEMKSREATISKIELLSYNYPEASFRAKVSAGTYIRSIAFDLGQIFETGGYVTKLRRTKIGELDIKLGQELENFDLNNELSIKELFNNKEFVELNSDILKKIDNGLKVKGNFDYKIGEDLFNFSNNQVTHIVEYDGEILIPKRKI